MPRKKIEKTNEIVSQAVRVRMAPSPTGAFHIGSSRTALFNYLFAKKNNGKFILRIEDTDKERSKKEWEDNINQSFEWLGISPDESPERPGAFGPYRQSERTKLYSKYLQDLIDRGVVYHCFCSKEELDAHREYQMSIGKPPIYSGKCSHLSKEEVKEKLEQGIEFVLRFRVGESEVKFNDLLRGEISYHTSTFGDFVVAKNIDEVLYNFACVIDDYEMQISHVIRGEEHISNTPRQILLCEALNLPIPQYLHLPLILNKNRAKLSKRDPEITAAVMGYKEKGYLPHALINFIALLGWSPGNDKEIFSLDELVEGFAVDKIQKSGAVFNADKLDWMNGYYIRNTKLSELTELCLPFLFQAGLIKPRWGDKEIVPLVHDRPFRMVDFEIIETKENVDINYLQKVVKYHQERLKHLAEIAEVAKFAFQKNVNIDKELLRWKQMTDQELKDSLSQAEEVLAGIKAGDWSLEKITAVLMDKANQIGDRGKLLWPLRVALTGEKASSSPFEVADILGKEKTLERINYAKEKI